VNGATPKTQRVLIVYLSCTSKHFQEQDKTQTSRKNEEVCTTNHTRHVPPNIHHQQPPCSTYPRVPVHHVPSTPALAVAVVGMLLGAQGSGMAHACLHLEGKGKIRGRQGEDKGKERGSKEGGGEEVVVRKLLSESCCQQVVVKMLLSASCCQEIVISKLLSGSCCQQIVVRKLSLLLRWCCVHLLGHR
jgi:hypothetical protein